MQNLRHDVDGIALTAADTAELLGVPVSVMQQRSRLGVGLQPRNGVLTAAGHTAADHGGRHDLPTYDLAEVLDLLRERRTQHNDSA